ncbi:Wall-associated protein precursor [Archangium sp.]|uniref:Wall-associated protein precursor n=1 Tax=Archangium sp. TaxID=1872627 RepID=UPI002D238312|nr:Wall-associated protein precursor [Archangium sp.]HYO55615.1 Wall-associated protein precursor [Archangium sp.]
MFASLLLLLLTQLPSTPGEMPAGCFCEVGAVGERGTLGQTWQERLAIELLEKAAAQARGVEEEASRKAGEAIEAGGASDCSEPKECKGQLHHVISRPIAKALEDHRTLRGQYKPRDSRFVTRAVDEKAHCGYQEWHRQVDAEVIQWLRRYEKATPAQFEALLRQIYSRPDMRARFPHGF